MDTTYEGWKNWETWNVILWIDNEEPLYRSKVAFLRGFCAEDLTADDVEQFCRELFPEGTPDMDKTDNGMNAVDWDEIVDHWQAEIAADYAA